MVSSMGVWLFRPSANPFAAVAKVLGPKNRSKSGSDPPPARPGPARRVHVNCRGGVRALGVLGEGRPQAWDMHNGVDMAEDCEVRHCSVSVSVSVSASASAYVLIFDRSLPGSLPSLPRSPGHHHKVQSPAPRTAFPAPALRCCCCLCWK